MTCLALFYEDSLLNFLRIWSIPLKFSYRKLVGVARGEKIWEEKKKAREKSLGLLNFFSTNQFISGASNFLANSKEVS